MGPDQAKTRRIAEALSRPPYAAAAVAVLLGIAACNQAYPEGKKTAEAMPDTSVPGDTAPDAAATGLVPENGTPPVQPNPPEAQAQPPGSPDVPVDLPEVDRSLPSQPQP
ncbi:MAG: hypothetical protein ACK4YQ_13125 [Phenylobacterium sp.]|uniref:hypothetical protein n=1 Tax=Phenylobacterium sp. TaxID=1871053 RepID=UPI00391BEE08